MDENTTFRMEHTDATGKKRVATFATLGEVYRFSEWIEQAGGYVKVTRAEAVVYETPTKYWRRESE